MHDVAASPETVPSASDGNLDIVARGNQTVHIDWHFPDAGSSVRIQVSDDAGNAHPPFELGLGQPLSPNQIILLGQNDIKFWVDAGDEQAVPGIYLHCRLPLTRSELFDAVIGAWYASAPEPAPGPGPDPYAPHDDEADATMYRVDAPPAAADLFPFVWMHAPAYPAQQDHPLLFARYAAFADLELCKDLLECAEPKAADQKRRLANAFRNGAVCIKIKTLDLQLSLMHPFADLRAALEALPHEPTMDALELAVHDKLGMSAAEFLAHPVWTLQREALWQTLYALALVGVARDAALLAALYPAARMASWLGLLADGTLKAVLPERRLRPLHATLSLPDVVALFGLAHDPAVPAVADPAVPAGRWEVLGVGTLKMARQRLHSYLPGELAEVVNVMPRERQEVQERQLTHSAEHSRQAGEQAELSSDQQQTVASSDLSDAMHAVMASDGLLRDMNKVHPSYADLDLTLSGAAAGGDAGAGWSGRNAAQLAQRLTEHAAKQLSQRVGWQRKRIWQQLQERRQSNLIDNTGNERLVGVYRWVDRVVHVHMVELGQRLVLSFMFDQPANDWLTQVKADSGIAATAPIAPLVFGAPDGKGYEQITEANYLGFGAFYGLSGLEPPPPATLRLLASFDRVSAAGGTAMQIPDGYLAESGEVTAALADNRYNLVGMVGGASISLPATGAPLQLTVPVPEGTALTKAGPESLAGAAELAATLTAPAPPQSGFGKTDISAVIKGRGGAIPVALMSAAPAFVVNLDVLCQRDPDPDGAGARAMSAWQVRIYQCLLQADRDARSSYVAAVGAAITAASAGRAGEVQREALQRRCMALLAPDAQPQWRTLADTLDWQAMTWQYDEWTVGAEPAWPEPAPPASTEPGSERLFRQFLRAPAARVLLTVNPGWEAWLLYWLQFQQPWAGGADGVPVTDSCAQLIAQLRQPGLLPGQTPPWTVRLPTSMLYLQRDDALPSFLEPLPSSAAGPA